MHISEFRGRLLDGAAETLLLDRLLAWCGEHQLLRVRGRQRTDSTHVLASVRALNSLASFTPDWIHAHSQPVWIERYIRGAKDMRLPKGQAARDTFALAIGADGARLITAAYTPDASGGYSGMPTDGGAGVRAVLLVRGSNCTGGSRILSVGGASKILATETAFR